MTPRQAFFQFGDLCFDYSDDFRTKREDVIDFALGNFKDRDFFVNLAAFLDELLDGGYTDEEIHALWPKTGARILYDQPHGTRWLMELARERVRVRLN